MRNGVRQTDAQLSVNRPTGRSSVPCWLHDCFSSVSSGVPFSFVNGLSFFEILLFRVVRAIPLLFSTTHRFTSRISMASRFNVVFVLGPPGSGKGTQCERIHNNLGYIHLSAGDLLREERQREGSEFGALIEEHIRNGTIVPVEITCKLLENAMNAAGDVKGFLIDGFPRNQDNLDGWQKEMGDKVNVQFVLFLSCPVETCIDRCLHRGQGRSDDNRESLEKRVNIYNTQTLPIVNYYRAHDLVKEISSEEDADTVYEKVVKTFNAVA